MNRRHVVEAQEQVQQALFDYTLNCYSHIPVSVYLKLTFLNVSFFLYLCTVVSLMLLFCICRTSLLKCWLFYRTFTPCHRAARSISISSISTAVHPHRLYSWKCFTPSGNNQQHETNQFDCGVLTNFPPGEHTIFFFKITILSLSLIAD